MPKCWLYRTVSLKLGFEKDDVAYCPRPIPGTDASKEAATKRNVDAGAEPAGKRVKIAEKKRAAALKPAMAPREAGASTSRPAYLNYSSPNSSSQFFSVQESLFSSPFDLHNIIRPKKAFGPICPTGCLSPQVNPYAARLWLPTATAHHRADVSSGCPSMRERRAASHAPFPS
jgi:hypothetical protein